MKTQRILIIIGSIVLGLLPIFNVVTVAILGVVKKRYWQSGIAIALLLMLIVLLSLPNNDTVAIIGGFTAISSMAYSALAFFYLVTPSLPKNEATKISQPSRPGKSPEKEQSLSDIIQDAPGKVGEQVKINEAFEDQIAAIPQITLIDAKKIVDERIRHGIFPDFRNFSERSRLSAATLKHIQPYLDFSVPQQPDTAPNSGRRIDF